MMRDLGSEDLHEVMEMVSIALEKVSLRKLTEGFQFVCKEKVYELKIYGNQITIKEIGSCRLY